MASLILRKYSSMRKDLWFINPEESLGFSDTRQFGLYRSCLLGLSRFPRVVFISIFNMYIDDGR